MTQYTFERLEKEVRNQLLLIDSGLSGFLESWSLDQKWVSEPQDCESEEDFHKLVRWVTHYEADDIREFFTYNPDGDPEPQPQDWLMRTWEAKPPV